MKISLTAKLSVFLMSLVIFAAPAAAQKKMSAASPRLNVSSLNLAESEDRILDLINQERLKNGLNELGWDERLANLARSYSERMANENFFSHYDFQGGTVDTRARERRIKRWNKIGENLFMCDRFGANGLNALAVRGWMKSPTHRQNILDAEFTDTGIGIARADDGKIYITQVFIEK